MRRHLPLLALAALAACSGGGVKAPPPPPSTVPISTSTTVAGPDYSQIELPKVAGRRRTTVAVRPGRAALTGVVTGPEGPVPGAVVQAERLVGDASAAVEVTTGADGRWAMAAIKGGRYRVRAWRAPDLALLRPEILFLPATGKRDLALPLDRHGGTGVTWAVAPNPPVVGEPANLAVRVTRGVVDDRGVVRTVPVSAVPVTLAGAGQWALQSANPSLTDGTGSARWDLRCAAPGNQPLSVTVEGHGDFPLTLPPCTEA